MHGRGGPNTAAADGPGGPIVAGDHRRRDSHTYFASARRERAQGKGYVWPAGLMTPFTLRNISRDSHIIVVAILPQNAPSGAFGLYALIRTTLCQKVRVLIILHVSEESSRRERSEGSVSSLSSLFCHRVMSSAGG